VDRHAPEARVDEGLREEAEWLAHRTAAHDAGQVPRHRVSLVTQAASAAAHDPGVAVRIERVERPADARPTGRGFGTLVHDVLAQVPLHAPDADVIALAQVLARVQGESDDDAVAAAAVVIRTLAHPLLQRARAAERRGQCRREWPVMGRLADGQLVEGQLDLAFEDDEGWTVVDLKTDAAPLDQHSAYQRQVGLYGATLRMSTGRPVVGVILQV